MSEWVGQMHSMNAWLKRFTNEQATRLNFMLALCVCYTRNFAL